jgi:hypothetical protein
LAVLAGIAALLSMLVVVTTRLTEQKLIDADDSSFSGSTNYTEHVNQEAINDYIRKHDPLLEPVPLGEVVTMTGDSGFGARLQATRADAADVASFTVRIQNLGTEPIDGSFSNGCAWLEMDDGERYYPPGVRSLMTGRSPSYMIDPNADSKLSLTFKIPTPARPARLILCLELGHYYPNAQWVLTP